MLFKQLFKISYFFVGHNIFPLSKSKADGSTDGIPPPTKPSATHPRSFQQGPVYVEARTTGHAGG
jgi:hypothetical protein